MIAQRPQLHLTIGPDRSLIWDGGGSVRYLVAEVSAAGTLLAAGERLPLNLGLAIDVSGSMAGDKLEAARATATAVVHALDEHDRLTIVAFGDEPHLLLNTQSMDEVGRRAAAAAIARLETLGCTNLCGGWDLAAGCVASALGDRPQASHRVLLLTDGLANVGITDAPSLARLCSDAQHQGILTSAVGIGDDYDEALLAAMVEAGGGRLHDATDATEIHEVVIGELLEGRAALVERTVLRLETTGIERAEVVGPWASSRDGTTLEVLVGSLRPEQTKHVVVRVFCTQGTVGERARIDAHCRAQTPDGSGEVWTERTPVVLAFATGETNRAQERDAARSVVALTAWQADAIRQALTLNREQRWSEAKHFLGREALRMRRYARGLRGAARLLREVDLLLAQVASTMDERVRKEVYVARTKSGRGEWDLRSRAPADVTDLLSRPRRSGR